MDSLNRLMKRDCVVCPSEGPPCTTCPTGEVCSLSVQTCEKCPEAMCVKSRNSSGNSSSHAGAIAGGVVGGLVGLGLIVGLLLWYKFRHRRKHHLQLVKEAQLEFDAEPSMGDAEMQNGSPGRGAPSITSTAGMTGQRSNVIPILLPFNISEANPNDLQARSRPYPPDRRSGFTSGVDRANPPVIRDSIGFSEYSIDSDSVSTNQGLRYYDLAVQGMPSLVDLNRFRKPPNRLPPLGSISEQEQDLNVVNYSPGSARSSPYDRQVTPTSARTSSMMRRHTIMSSRSVDAALPAIPSDESSKSPFDDSQSVQNERRVFAAGQRFSRASTEYVADLPEEAGVYVDHASFH